MEFDRFFMFSVKYFEDDQSWVNLFDQGLCSHIRRGLASLYLISYAEVMERAK